MPQFQPWFLELFSLISNIAVSIAAIFGIYGIWQWQRELIGTSKFELARKMMKSALQFRDEFEFVRSPHTFGNESTEREIIQNEAQGETHLRNEYFARSKRLQKLQIKVRELQEYSWEAEVLLSKSDARSIDPLMDAYKSISIAINGYFYEQINYGSRDSHYFQRNQERLNKLHETIYSTGGDELGKSVHEAVERLISELRKYVK